MDRLSSVMTRAALVWLLAGVLVGALMLAGVIPGNWRRWTQPSHAHMLFVGWFAQFAIGIAYWLLPRRRTADRPLGYVEALALGAVFALNLGLLLRVVGEPLSGAGGAPVWAGFARIAAALLQAAAFTVFVVQLWPRLGTRVRREPAPGSGRQADRPGAIVRPAPSTTRRERLAS